MSECILRVDNLSKHFIVMNNSFSKSKVIDAVKNVSFKVNSQRSLGLVGESGSGKTTIANLVLRLIEPTSGMIELFGDDIVDIDEKIMRKYRKNIQIIFQHSNSALDPKMTMEELIKEPLKIHHIVVDKQLDEEVDRLINMVGLPDNEKWKFPNQLSGGQIQRIIIARAIATRPRLIVCDEPVSALDVSVQGQILNLLIRLKKELDLTYLFISHDLKVVRYMCEEIAVMYRGEIIEIGEMNEVLNRPNHNYTKKLFEAML